MRYRFEGNRKKAKIIRAIGVISFVLVLITAFLLISFYFVQRQTKGKRDGDSLITNEQVKNTPQTKEPDEQVDKKEYQSARNANDILSVSFKNSYSEASLNTPLNDDPLWNLVLLNPGNGIKSEIPMERVKFDEQYIDKRIQSEYQAMVDEAKKSGITLYLRSGYRSINTQRNNYNNAISKYINKGETDKNAVKITEQYYTRPGHSEHHCGLALDIITPEYHNDIYSLDERFAKTEAYTWLIDNCDRFGFVLRYPEDKSDITKINFEPWHYRYVGKEHAAAMKESGLCLEEYLFKLLNGFEEETNETTREAIAQYAAAFPKSLKSN